MYRTLLLGAALFLGLSAFAGAPLKLDASYKIAVPAKADSKLLYAAEDLQEHLLAITGKKPEVVRQDKPSGKCVILKHDRSMDAEAWKLQTQGENLIITGGYPRGVQYGVCEFLERFGNCRWFTPTVSRIPKADFIVVPEKLDLSGQPWFLQRNTSYLFTFDMAPLREWRRFFVHSRQGNVPWCFTHGSLKTDIYGSANRIGAPNLTHTFYDYQKDWKDVKPEFYAMDENGKRYPRMANNRSGAQFCLTNPELRDRIFAQLLKFIREDRKKAEAQGLPYPKYYSLVANDNPRFCHCPACQKLNEAPENSSESYADFLNDLARRLNKVYPDLYLAGLAYENTKYPPKSVMEKNVVMGMAFLDSEFLRDENADAIRPVQHVSNKEAFKCVQGWAAKTPGGISLYGYGQHFCMQFRLPCDVTHKIDQDLKFSKKLGGRLLTMEMYDRDSSFYWLRRYVLNKLAVDPDLKLQDLVNEFMEGYYGPAAEPMKAYYRLLADATEKEPKQLGVTPVTLLKYLSPEFFSKADELLGKAEKLAGKNERVRNAVQDERLPLDGVRIHHYDQIKAAVSRDVLLKRYLAEKERLGEDEGLYKMKNIHHTFITYGGIDCEKVILATPLPEEFKGRNALVWFAVSQRNGQVKDPEAAGGVALKLGKDPYHNYFRTKLHDSRARKDIPREYRITKFPADEKYHWHYVSKAELNPDIIYWCEYFQNDLRWANLPPPANEMEVYVSLKFTGPVFVPGSQKPNGIFLDRILAVPPKK